MNGLSRQNIYVIYLILQINFKIVPFTNLKWTVIDCYSETCACDDVLTSAN